MSFTTILAIVCLLLFIASMTLLIKGVKHKDLKYIILSVILLLAPLGLYFALLYFISRM